MITSRPPRAADAELIASRDYNPRRPSANRIASTLSRARYFERHDVTRCTT